MFLCVDHLEELDRWEAVMRMEFGKVSAKQPDPEPQAWIYRTCVSPFLCCLQSRRTQVSNTQT